MNYGLKKPCKSCPFVMAHNFPLMPDRIREIEDASSFPCHNTVDYDALDYESLDGEPEYTFRDREGEHQCLGWLVLQWAQHRGFSPATAFMASRGLFSPEELPSPEEVGCFETFDAYVAHEEDRS